MGIHLAHTLVAARLPTSSTTHCAAARRRPGHVQMTRTLSAISKIALMKLQLDAARDGTLLLYVIGQPCNHTADCLNTTHPPGMPYLLHSVVSCGSHISLGDGSVLGADVARLVGRSRYK